jgi:hypothetical protein
MRPSGTGSIVGRVEDPRARLVVPSARATLTTPRAAAIAGIAFAALLGASMILLRLSIPAAPATAAAFTPGHRTAVVVALNLVPYAGIAFLWFIAVVRDRIGEFEDRFFGTVFLGSGLIFLALLCAASAVAGGLVAAADTGPLGPDVWSVGRSTIHTVLAVYATKMAGVFMISTATIAFRTRVLPRWLAASGLGLALVMVVLGGWVGWLELAFPAWVLMVSLHILRAGLRRAADQRDGRIIP